VVRLIEQHVVPGVTQVVRDDDLRPVPAHRSRGDTAERHPVLQYAVRLTQKLHLVDPDDSCRRALLLLADQPRSCRIDGVDACLAAGDEAVHDGLSLIRPAGHGGGSAILQVVGVGDDRQGTLPVLCDGLERTGAGLGH
jgi:hypothetical protein